MIVAAVISGLLGGGLISFFMAKVNKEEVESKTALNEASATEIIRRISAEALEDMEKRNKESLKDMEDRNKETLRDMETRMNVMDAGAKKKDIKISSMSNQINALQSAFNQSVGQIRYLLDGIRSLTQQLNTLDQTPCWKPEEMDDWPPVEGLDYDA